MSGGWIGVDLDGTLAYYNGGGVQHIGPPISAMVDRVRSWLDAGADVRIFTARVAACHRVNDEGQADDGAFAAAQQQLIEAWCLIHLGRILPVTATKDFHMIQLWDDRCIQVVTNTGALVGADD